nr:hypothetical protein [Tanacetum cinerariifolium]
PDDEDLVDYDGDDEEPKEEPEQQIGHGNYDAPRATVTVSSTYEVGGPSTAAIKGPSFPLPAPGLHVPPTSIEDLSTRLGNLEYRHGVLMRKMEESGYCKGASTGDGITDSASGEWAKGD